MAKILIVEDDNKLRDEVGIFFINNGYEVDYITSFNNTIATIKEKICDLILLDINLPNVNGEIICKNLRKNMNTPIIIVTSRNNELDELISINYGADDFITKPYNTHILLARVERLLDRTNNSKEQLMYDKLIIDNFKSILILDNQEIDLSKNELKILTFLLKNKNKIVSRDDLMNYLWNTNEYIDDNTLTVNINRLRNKLESLGYTNMIVTKRGQGYIII